MPVGGQDDSLLFRRLKLIFSTAMLVRLLSVPFGLYFSFQLDLASGPGITAILLFVLFAALAVKLITGWVRRQRQRLVH